MVHQVWEGKSGGHLARWLVLDQTIQLHIPAWFSHGAGARGSQAEVGPWGLHRGAQSWGGSGVGRLPASANTDQPGTHLCLQQLHLKSGASLLSLEFSGEHITVTWLVYPTALRDSPGPPSSCVLSANQPLVAFPISDSKYSDSKVAELLRPLDSQVQDSNVLSLVGFSIPKKPPITFSSNRSGNLPRALVPTRAAH